MRMTSASQAEGVIETLRKARVEAIVSIGRAEHGLCRREESPNELVVCSSPFCERGAHLTELGRRCCGVEDAEAYGALEGVGVVSKAVVQAMLLADRGRLASCVLVILLPSRRINRYTGIPAFKRASRDAPAQLTEALEDVVEVMNAGVVTVVHLLMRDAGELGNVDDTNKGRLASDSKRSRKPGAKRSMAMIEENCEPFIVQLLQRGMHLVAVGFRLHAFAADDRRGIIAVCAVVL